MAIFKRLNRNLFLSIGLIKENPRTLKSTSFSFLSYLYTPTQEGFPGKKASLRCQLPNLLFEERKFDILLLEASVLHAFLHIDVKASTIETIFLSLFQMVTQCLMW